MFLKDEILLGSSEERFTRKKHDANFPHYVIKYCLKEGASQINNVVFYEKPFVKFERLLELICFRPKGL